jgi:cation diffusion facilitator CzcD-associated flavoprotein CzcO
VGSGNSDHDISQKYYENCADVTMLQHRSTYVISARTGLLSYTRGCTRTTAGRSTADADVYGQSMPIPVQFTVNVTLTDRIKAAEQGTLDGLAETGFALDFGHDGSGLFRKYVTRGGAYYIDVGASQLIIDDKIKIRHCPSGIRELNRDGLVLADSIELLACTSAPPPPSCPAFCREHPDC